MTDVHPGFAEYFALIKQRAGLSQKELAEKAGVSTVTILNLKRRKFANASVSLIAVAKALGVECSTPTGTMVSLRIPSTFVHWRGCIAWPASNLAPTSAGSPE